MILIFLWFFFLYFTTKFKTRHVEGSRQSSVNQILHDKRYKKFYKKQFLITLMVNNTTNMRKCYLNKFFFYFYLIAFNRLKLYSVNNTTYNIIIMIIIIIKIHKFLLTALSPIKDNRKFAKN